MRGRQRRDAHGELVILRMLRRPCEVSSVRVIHPVAKTRREESLSLSCRYLVRQRCDWGGWVRPVLDRDVGCSRVFGSDGTRK